MDGMVPVMVVQYVPVNPLIIVELTVETAFIPQVNENLVGIPTNPMSSVFWKLREAGDGDRWGPGMKLV